MSGKLIRRSALSDTAIEQMYELFSSQFDNVPMQQFLQDLDGKNWIMMLCNKSGDLYAFSTMHVYDLSIGDRSVSLIFSGDTVVDSSTWSDSALSYNLMGAFDWLRRHRNSDRLYWFLLVSGYRTYRLLPVFSNCFYPRFDEPTPENIRALMHTMATERFNSSYDPKTGIVRLDAPSILREGYRNIPEHRLTDPNIAFFAKRNPGHEQGDELVCFCDLAEYKLTKLGQRMWRKGQKLFPDNA